MSQGNGFRDVTYEDSTRGQRFEALMRELMRPIMVHRFALARMRKDLREGNPYPRRVKGNRELAEHAQQECEGIMSRYADELKRG